jgi:radical SAM superfamily enzyme YgiQ (UPF0313 family)
MSNKVVLFFPPYDGPPLGAPLSLLSLASPLLEGGFDVCLIDGKIKPDYERKLIEETADALLFGVSLLTGSMIRPTIRVARTVRELRPSLPIIFGGWHPTLMPEQTLKESFINAIVRGPGEHTLVELAQKCAVGAHTHGVLGTTSKCDGQIVRAPERPVPNINVLPMPAYSLVDFDAYEKARGMREIGYASSLGCPYACNYCTDQVFYKRRFNGLSSERVVSEVIELVERYRLDDVAFLDSNFLVDVNRAVRIAAGFAESKTKVSWTVQASTDLLCRMTDDQVRILGEGGLHHMGFGTESASEPVLLMMNKKHQRIVDMYETARKTQLAGIRTTFNIILGYPGETEEDRLKTFRTMSDIARQFSNVSFSPNVFTPYPGIPIWPQLRELGVHEPQSLEEWANVSLGSNLLPWLQGEELRRLRRMLEYFLLNNQVRRRTAHTRWLRETVRRALGAPLRWRLRHNRYSFPWELWVARTTERLVTRRSLLTGQQLTHTMNEVC